MTPKDMGMNAVTPQEYNVLDQLSYLDFGFDGTDTSGNLQQICSRIVAEKGAAAGEAVQVPVELSAKMGLEGVLAIAF